MMKMKFKKKLSWQLVSKIFGYLLFAYVIMVLVFPSVSFLGRYQHYVIATPSMHPVIKQGDVVVINRAFNYSDLSEGDIISFHADIFNDGNPQVVVHYIETIVILEDGSRAYRTKSEVAPTIDPWTLSDDDIDGLYVFHFGGLGKFLLFAQSGIGRITLIGNIIVVLIVFHLLKQPKKAIPEEKMSDLPDKDESL